MIQEIVKTFEEASKGFLQEQKAFILSGVSERSLCGELMKYLTIEMKGESLRQLRMIKR